MIFISKTSDIYKRRLLTYYQYSNSLKKVWGGGWRVVKKVLNMHDVIRECSQIPFFRLWESLSPTLWLSSKWSNTDEIKMKKIIKKNIEVYPNLYVQRKGKVQQC